MEFWDWIWVAVIGGVAGGMTVAAILGVRRWLWERRRKPSEWTEARKAAKSRRHSQTEAEEHADLVDQVLMRAEVLQLKPGEDLAVAVTPGPGYVTVTFPPTGRRFLVYPDQESRKRGAERGEHIGSNAHFGTPPVIVSKWSDDDLRAWLRKYKDREPPANDRA